MHPGALDQSQGRQHEFSEGDVIGVLYRRETRQVSFYRNGSPQFVNSRVTPDEDLYPVVYMHYGNDQVSIKENSRLPLTSNK